MTSPELLSPTYALRPDSRAAWTEPTLDDLMSDPLVRAVMRADRIDDAEMDDLLGRAAGRLRKDLSKPRSGEGKFDPLTARWFPRPLRVDATPDTGSRALSVLKTGGKPACGTPCPW